MSIPDFALERYFAHWESSAQYVLCASDVEGYPMRELLGLADDQALSMWENLSLDYTHSSGHPLLRAEIASLYATVSAEEVLVCAGADEAIFCLVNVLLGPGDHAIVVWPGYQSLYEVARATGADVTLHELHEEDAWALDVDRLLAALRPETRLVVVNVPHNPTGMLPTPSEWARLTRALDGAGVHLLSDEVYRFLEFDGVPPLAASVDLCDRGISIGVMSKSFAMAGLRIGWLATHDRALLARVAAFKDYTTICSSAPSEVLAIIGLRARESVLRRSRSIIETNLPHVDRFFAQWAEMFSWVRPMGGSMGFPRLLSDVPVDRFAADLVEAEGVLLLPGSIFGHTGNHFRLGFGRSDLPEALARLESFLSRSNGRTGSSEPSTYDRQRQEAHAG
jgi:aspartate/methionine/tyrosine aminotransferase